MNCVQKLPEVVRLVTYQEVARSGESNIPATGGRLPLPEGMASLLFYNNDTEYIVFNDLTAVATASATTRTVSRGNFQKPHASERTMNQPDMLYGNYEENYETERTLEPVKLPVRMKPLVYTYLIRYEFKKGLQYVALARGALAGMAESVYLKDGHTGDETATILFDCTKEDYRGGSPGEYFRCAQLSGRSLHQGGAAFHAELGGKAL